jgi:hypothetical protein
MRSKLRQSLVRGAVAVASSAGMAVPCSALSAAALVLAMLLPFLPGRYDPLAEPLAALASALAATVVVAAAGVTAAAAGSISAGAIVAAGWLACVGRLWRKASAVNVSAAGTRTLPMALIAVPLVAVVARVALVPIAATAGRDRAIANAAGILDDIERFRQRTGRYPSAIQSLVPDYHPDVIGIERYRYEPSGEAFNLYFEAPSTDLATRLIVMYNPRGEQDFSSHAFDLLQLSPEEIRRQRGYFASETLPQPGWKVFLFD